MAVDGDVVRAELENYEWQNATWTGEKLIAASPFRYDRRPSFYVWLQDSPTSSAKAGYWGDSGTGERGNFVSLLAHLRGESEADTAAYLRAAYGTGEEYNTGETLTLDMAAWGRLENNEKKRPQPLDVDILDAYKWRHPYLARRGISESVQRMMRVGYCRDSKAVTIPWFLPDGRLATIMYRKVQGKAFWYRRGGISIGDLVYGVNVVYRRRLKTAILVEAPIDAMYLMTAGFPALAIGGAQLNAAKRDIILRSPIEEMIIMADHDKAGQLMKRQIIEQLEPFISVKVAGFPMRYKDVNDIKYLDELRKYVKKARIVRTWKNLPLESLGN